MYDTFPSVMLVRVMVYWTIQSASMAVHERSAEVREWGEMEGLSGAEGGPTKKMSLILVLKYFYVLQ